MGSRDDGDMSSFPELSPSFRHYYSHQGCCSVLLEHRAVGVGEGLRALGSPVHLMGPWVCQGRWLPVLVTKGRTGPLPSTLTFWWAGQP